MKRALDSESASRAEDSSTLEMPVLWGDHQVEHQGQVTGASQSLEDKLPTLCGQAGEVTQVLTASQVLVSFGACIQVHIHGTLCGTPQLGLISIKAFL